MQCVNHPNTACDTVYTVYMVSVTDQYILSCLWAMMFKMAQNLVSTFSPFIGLFHTICSCYQPFHLGKKMIVVSFNWITVQKSHFFITNISSSGNLQTHICTYIAYCYTICGFQCTASNSGIKAILYWIDFLLLCNIRQVPTRLKIIQV